MWGYFSKVVDRLVSVPGLVVCQVIRDIICKKLWNNFDSHLGFLSEIFLHRLLFSFPRFLPLRLCFTTLSAETQHSCVKYVRKNGIATDLSRLLVRALCLPVPASQLSNRAV